MHYFVIPSEQYQSLYIANVAAGKGYTLSPRKKLDNTAHAVHVSIIDAVSDEIYSQLIEANTPQISGNELKTSPEWNEVE